MAGVQFLHALTTTMQFQHISNRYSEGPISYCDYKIFKTEVLQIEAVPSAKHSGIVATSQALPESVRNHFQMQQIQLENRTSSFNNKKTNLNAGGKIGAKYWELSGINKWTSHRGSCGYRAD
jgi:hypothetical protein